MKPVYRFMKMFEILCFFVIFCLTVPNFALLRHCSQVGNKTLQPCSTGEEKFPVVLKSEVYLKEIVEIHQEKNSITLRLNIWTYWTDKSLALSDDSVE